MKKLCLILLLACGFLSRLSAQAPMPAVTVQTLDSLNAELTYRVNLRFSTMANVSVLSFSKKLSGQFVLLKQVTVSPFNGYYSIADGTQQRVSADYVYTDVALPQSELPLVTGLLVEVTYADGSSQSSTVSLP